MKATFWMKTAQLVVLQLAQLIFVFLAGSTGWVYTRGSEADLLRWLPIIVLGNAFVLASIGAGANKGPWPRRILTLIPALGVVCLIWYATAYILRSLFLWDATYAAVAAQAGSFLGTILFALKHLADGVAAEERDETQKRIQNRLEQLEDRLRSGQDGKRGRKKNRR